MRILWRTPCLIQRGIKGMEFTKTLEEYAKKCELEIRVEEVKDVDKNEFFRVCPWFTNKGEYEFKYHIGNIKENEVGSNCGIYILRFLNEKFPAVNSYQFVKT